MIIETEIDIAAPPMKVWRALCDFGGYRRWNPYREIVGVAALGERVTLLIGPDPEKRRKLAARISVFEPGRQLSMASGRRPLGWAIESYRLEPSRRGTRLRHSAEMAGLGIMLLGRRWFEPRLTGVYERVDSALAKHVASGPQPRTAAKPRPRSEAGR